MTIPSFTLIFAVALLAGCSSRALDRQQSASPTQRPPDPTVTPIEAPPIPVLDRNPLTASQRKRLDATLPKEVREVLEESETLAILGVRSEELAGLRWEPDVRAELPKGSRRTELLDSFFYDASAGPNPSACFIPRHGLQATHRGKTVEVIICFQCHLFVVRGDLGEYDGGVYKEGSASHQLFEDLLQPLRR